jgi:hypothetical protein
MKAIFCQQKQNNMHFSVSVSLAISKESLSLLYNAIYTYVTHLIKYMKTQMRKQAIPSNQKKSNHQERIIENSERVQIFIAS